MKKTLEKILILGMALMLVLSAITVYSPQQVSGAITDKPAKTTIKTFSSGIGKGYLDISWKAMSGATNYKVLISNGYNYEYFLTGNVTSWSTKGKNIFPTKEEIAQGKYKFHTDGKGTEFASDPRSLYENGYKAGSTFGLRNQQKYIVRVMAIYSNGEGPTSDITDAYVPSDKLESGEIKTYSNGVGTGSGYIDVSWKAVPAAINYKVIISNGYNYEHFTTGNVTSWTTKGKKMYPTKDEINQGKYNFHTDGKGLDFASDPRALYENGYKAGSTFGLRNQERYIVRVAAIYSWGEGTASDIIDAYMPPETPVDKPSKSIIKTVSNGEGTGTGYMNVSWTPVSGAVDYKVIISNGYNYEYFKTGNVTSWTTKGKNIFPTSEELENGKYKFHTDGNGVEFANDPRSLYENGYQVGSTFGLRNQKRYIVRILAVYPWGDGPTSDITDAYMPNEVSGVQEGEVVDIELNSAEVKQQSLGEAELIETLKATDESEHEDYLFEYLNSEENIIKEKLETDEELIVEKVIVNGEEKDETYQINENEYLNISGDGISIDKTEEGLETEATPEQEAELNNEESSDDELSFLSEIQKNMNELFVGKKVTAAAKSRTKNASHERYHYSWWGTKIFGAKIGAEFTYNGTKVTARTTVNWVKRYFEGAHWSVYGKKNGVQKPSSKKRVVYQEATTSWGLAYKGTGLVFHECFIRVNVACNQNGTISKSSVLDD